MLKFLSSSTNSAKLSLTIKGILVGIAPLIYMLAGGSVSPEDWNGVVEGIVGVITGIFSVLSAFMVVYGGIRKVVLAIKGNFWKRS